MAERFHYQGVYGVVIAAILLVWPSVTYAQQEKEEPTAVNLGAAVEGTRGSAPDRVLVEPRVTLRMGTTGVYKLNTMKPFKTVDAKEVADFLDVTAGTSNRRISMFATQYGSGPIKFYDADGALIKEIYVSVEHPVTILKGARAGESFQCWDTGCQQQGAGRK